MIHGDISGQSSTMQHNSNRGDGPSNSGPQAQHMEADETDAEAAAAFFARNFELGYSVTVVQRQAGPHRHAVLFMDANVKTTFVSHIEQSED